jgi:16S rRNA (adenine1518-N6/adenine1519-N6)-dimethyltransferase
VAARYLDRAAIRRIAGDCEFEPSSSDGYHLHDAPTVRHIAAVAGVGPGKHVLHVGAGMGALTLALLNRGARVTAVETDAGLARQLPKTLVAYTHARLRRLEVLHKNALDLQAADFARPPTSLVCTLPQGDSCSALLRFLTHFPSIEVVTMVAESTLVERVLAPPGSARRHVLGVKASFFGEVRRCGAIAPIALWPLPKQYFGICRLDCDRPARWRRDTATCAGVFDLVDAAFRHRRITIRKALDEWAGSGSESARRLLTASIDPSRPVEDLDIADFVRLYQVAGGG